MEGASTSRTCEWPHRFASALPILRLSENVVEKVTSETPLFWAKWGRPEKVRALLGHQRIDTTQIYASIWPTQLKRAVGFYEEKARRMLRQ